MRISLLLWFAFAVAIGANGQANTPAPASGGLAFEVATIKPANPDPRQQQLNGIKMYPGGRVVLRGVSLKTLVVTAFAASYWQVAEGDAWINNDNYDIEAKPPSGLQPPITDLRYTWTAIEEPRLREMLQALLADRFQLRIRRETKTGTVYLLERSDKKLALQPVRSEEARTKTMGDENFSGNLGWAGSWNIYNSTMPQIAKFASDNMLHAPVLDRTNLSGAFDYRQPQSPASDLEDRGDAASFQNFIRDIGLKLERTTGPVETLVIDHAEKPSPN